MKFLHKCLYIVITLLLIQVVGYFTIAQSLLVDKLLEERERIVSDMDEFDGLVVRSNYTFDHQQLEKTHHLFSYEPMVFETYEKWENIPTIFLEDQLTYTFDFSRYQFLTAIVSQSESIMGFGASDTVKCVWLWFTWVEIEYSSGMS
ncbi:MAG: hypothetical protein AAF740_00330 [Bacteroidota bacterium]